MNNTSLSLQFKKKNLKPPINCTAKKMGTKQNAQSKSYRVRTWRSWGRGGAEF
jgi:hypothetical protein